MSGFNVGSTVGIGIGSSGVGVGVATMDGVGTGVAPEARSPTLRFTFGTESSNTLLSIVMSPEPVTSIETVLLPLFNLIETWALGEVMPPTVLTGAAAPVKSDRFDSIESDAARQCDRGGVQVAIAIEVQRHVVACFDRH